MTPRGFAGPSASVAGPSASFARPSANLPLPIGASVRVMLVEGAAPPVMVSAIARTADGKTAWEWSPDALARGADFGVNLAVRQVPLIPGVHTVGKRELRGLPGFLHDSLPDAWGRLVTERALKKLGVPTERLTGLDALVVVGQRGPGALVFEPDFPMTSPSTAVDLDRLAADAALTLEGEDVELLVELAKLGGSAGGSRPKAWIAVADGRIRSGAETLRPDETGWLVKFRAKHADPEDIGPLEYAYTKMALEAGLDTAEPWLIETAAGRYFASRRFDRDTAGRVHVLSAAGLLDVSPEQAMAADYGDLLRLTRHVTRSEAEVVEAYRHAVFNVLSHNRDDHLRQFAFVRRQGAWRRSPAFDLTFSDGPGGEHTLLVAGESRHPRHEHLERLAKDAGIRPRTARDVLDRVRGAVARWDTLATEVGVSSTSRTRVASALAAL